MTLATRTIRDNTRVLLTLLDAGKLHDLPVPYRCEVTDYGVTVEVRTGGDVRAWAANLHADTLSDKRGEHVASRDFTGVTVTVRASTPRTAP